MDPVKPKLQTLKDLGQRALPLATLLVIASLLSVFIPAIGAHWVDMLTISGMVNTGTWNNCTYTQGYWKNHPEAWPIEEITIGDVTYTQADAIAILKTAPRGGDATRILARQLIPAKLNVLQGADPSAVETTITDADTWLIAYPLGSDPSNPNRKEGIALSGVLDDYNNGITGPGHCD